MNLKTVFLSLVACSFFAAEMVMGENVTPEEASEQLLRVIQTAGDGQATASASALLYMTDEEGETIELEARADVSHEDGDTGETLIEAIDDMLSGLGENANPLVIAALEAAKSELVKQRPDASFDQFSLEDAINEALVKAAKDNDKKRLFKEVRASKGGESGTITPAFSAAELRKQIAIVGVCRKGFVIAAAGVRTLTSGGSEAVAFGMRVSFDTCADEEEKNGGVFDDPHFKTWSGKYFSYHGQCDLVMMENPSFGDGLGLDLHIRTTIEDYYSAITSAALRIGSDVIEIDANDVYFNSQKVVDGDKPTSIAGFPIEYIPDPKGNIRTEITVGKNNQNEKIVFRWKKGFMGVLFEIPSKKNFEGSYGVLGTFEFGLLVGRDGFTEFENTSEFVEQWQVKDTDDKLFHDLHRAPQYPMRCIMPQVSETKVRRRRLQRTISREQAANACAHWPKQGQESCIFDVMMTGDLEMADDPF
jgi:hypothetical protein